jgi:hypothetical protein
MNVQPGSSANFEPVDSGDKAVATDPIARGDKGVATAARPADRVPGAKYFKVLFILLAMGAQAVWAAFLVSLAIRYIF